MSSIRIRDRVLATLQLAIATLASILEIAGACRSCTLGGVPLRLAIAAAGVAGYAALAAAAWLGRDRLFHVGVAAAAGVHAALILWMVHERAFCVLCLAAAAGAFALVVSVAAARMRHGLAIAPLAQRAFLPALLATGSLAYASAAAEARRSEERTKDLALLSRQRDRSPEATPVRVTVYESPACPYCVEFRERFLPRLAADFGAEVEVTFLDARETSWVRRTPTITVEGGPVYEGLPYRYEDLAGAIAKTSREESR